MQMSELDILNVVRKTWTAQAVQVTDDNIEAVARWCGGDIRMYHTSELGVMGRRIDLAVHGFRGVTTIDRAYVGYWVVFTQKDSSFMVYKDKAFRATYETREEKVRREGMTEPEIAARNHQVLQLVKRAMTEQDLATYYSKGSEETKGTAEAITEEILKLFV
ncbi:hypothetical protein SEA_GIRLPOWER_67 [Streptomyces phage GirlPower]|nr:hypothetical protein SEA_GIRLPOWER_67 [Streptomyces phage GirlPower]